MRITKDEARILGAALEGQKFDLAALISRSKEETMNALEGLETLEIKLEYIGKDERRKGKKSQDGIRDVLKRFIKGRKH
jgi:hypothetical protein